jgi:hypothetical protein
VIEPPVLSRPAEPASDEPLISIRPWVEVISISPPSPSGPPPAAVIEALVRVFTMLPSAVTVMQPPAPPPVSSPPVLPVADTSPSTVTLPFWTPSPRASTSRVPPKPPAMVASTCSTAELPMTTSPAPGTAPASMSIEPPSPPVASIEPVRLMEPVAVMLTSPPSASGPPNTVITPGTLTVAPMMLTSRRPRGGQRAR